MGNHRKESVPGRSDKLRQEFGQTQAEGKAGTDKGL